MKLTKGRKNMYAESKKRKFSQIDLLINELNSESETARKRSKIILKLAIEKLIREGAAAQ